MRGAKSWFCGAKVAPYLKAKRAMRFLPLKLMCCAVFGASVLALPVAAQEALQTPAGWTKSAVAGDLVYSKPDGSRFVVQKLVPLSASLRAWFESQTARDGASRGQLVSPGQIKAQSSTLAVGRTFRSSQGHQFVIYIGYAVKNQGRLFLFSGPNQSAVTRSVRELSALSGQFAARDAAARSATGGGRAPVQATAGARVPVIAARGPLKQSQIVGLFLQQGYTTGVGGMMIVEYNPILLLRDGSARRDLEIPPLDINLASDKRAHASDWGRWTRKGKKVVVRWPRGSSDEFETDLKTRPARPGQTIKDRFASMGGGGNTAMGGGVMTFYSNEYTFASNGSFLSGSSGGGSNNSDAGSVTAMSNSKNAGRYRLDGHALTLRFNDGRVVRRLFYFYPDSYHVIGIGNSTFIGDDKSR